MSATIAPGLARKIKKVRGGHAACCGLLAVKKLLTCGNGPTHDLVAICTP
jgi:hypothetical protein